MIQNLVIVESPTKARTLSQFLGKGYQIEASMGHIRDLPKADLGVDIEHNFEPKYIIPRDKKKRVNELKKVAKEAKTLYLATDPDREGEAIAWHLATLMGSANSELHIANRKNHKPSAISHPLIYRVVFHEITSDAIKDAFAHPRSINLQLVDAQQARRVLDRLVGYKLSPLLWKKIKRGLSAGRVQSVALRLVVEREKEIEAFKPVEYWTIDAELESSGKGQESRFVATLIELAGKKIEISKKEEADKHLANLETASYQIEKVIQKEIKRYPSPPFITSTLQQTAGNKLGFTAKKTMMLAQNLYERGLITYMRTDSFNLSSQAISAARSYIQKSFGKPYLPNTPRVYRSKSKNAQEAHEAIRPTNISLQSSAISHQNGLNKDHARLYDLVWKRMAASQMSEAVMDQTTVDVMTNSGYKLRATGSVLKFDGWLKVYGVKEVEEEENTKNQLLPQLREGEDVKLLQLLPEQHFTEAPPRFTEASLIKKLEELGIGRPSTYAPILSTIQDRFYVEKEERKFIPTQLGVAVAEFLIKFFPDLFDYAFTAQMEDALDEISRGERQWRKTIGDFYKPMEEKLEKTMDEAERVEIKEEVTDKICPECGKSLVVRRSRFGKFLACSGFPECKHTESIEDKLNIKCPKCGGEVIKRRTKKGRPFYGCSNYPNCKFASWTKPKS